MSANQRRVLLPIKRRQYNSHISPPTAFPIHAASGLPSSSTSPSRKRRADSDIEPDFQYSSSSLSCPSRVTKRSRQVPTQRSLGLPRILESLEKDALRTIIESICSSNPVIHSQLLQAAPRPTADSCLKLLSEYESRFQSAFPEGGNQGSDYAYNRVRSHLVALLDALNDYTPSFLPPTESQLSTSLAFLDAVTAIVHRIPRWNTIENNSHKNNAYADLSDAWSTVIREAAKHNGGFAFVNAGWNRKLASHNQHAAGKLDGAMREMVSQISWLGSDSSAGGFSSWNAPADTASPSRPIILTGEPYVHGAPVQVGPW